MGIKNLGGKIQKTEKSGGVCNFGTIWKNSAYPPPGSMRFYLKERFSKQTFVENCKPVV